MAFTLHPRSLVPRLALGLTLLTAAVASSFSTSPVRAASVAAAFMLDNPPCATALSAGPLIFSLNQLDHVTTGSSVVCLVLLTDAMSSDAILVKIVDSNGTVVNSGPPGVTGAPNGSGVYNLIVPNLTYTNAATAWPDGSYRTDVLVNCKCCYTHSYEWNRAVGGTGTDPDLNLI